jgi:hypothetical protein
MRDPIPIDALMVKSERPSFITHGPWADDTDTPAALDVYKGSRVTDLAVEPAMKLRKRGYTDRQIITPRAWVRAGRSDASCPTEGVLDKYLSTATTLYLSMKNRSASSLLAAAHADEMKKAGAEYGRNPIADLGTPTYHDDFDEQSRTVPTHIVRAFRTTFADAAVPHTLAAKRRTQHGAPTFRSTDIDQLAHFAIAYHILRQRANTTAQALKIIERVASELEALMPTGVGMFALLNERTGPIGKAQEYWAFDKAGVLRRLGSRAGVNCRARLVRMVMTWINEVCRVDTMRTTARIKQGRIGVNFQFGRSADVNALIFNHLHGNQRLQLVSADLSNMDDTVSRALIKQVSADVADYGPHAHAGALYILDLPMLGGALHRGDAGFLFSCNRGNKSGQIQTSLHATVIRFLVALACLEESGLSDAADGVFSGQYLTLTQGDDWLGVLPAFDHERFAAASASFGFKERVETYPVFLKVWHERPGLWHTLASRMFTRSMTRERPAPGPLTELFAVGVRAALARRDPYFELFWQALCDVNPLLQGYGVKRPNDIPQVLRRYPGAFADEIRAPQGRERFSNIYASLFNSYDDTRSGVIDRDTRGFYELLLRVAPGLTNQDLTDGGWASAMDLLSNGASFNWRRYLSKLNTERDRTVDDDLDEEFKKRVSV